MNVLNSGPNQVLPAESFKTTKINGAVKLRLPQSGNGLDNEPPISVPGLLQRSAERYGNRPALMYKTLGTWIPITYKEYLEQVRCCAKAFIKLGLERYHTVGILGFNSVEWFISNLAAIFAGGVSVGIYTTNSSEACFHSCSDSKANIIVVQDQNQLNKILAIKSRLPELKAIVQYEGEPTSPGVISWSDLMIIGRDQDDEKLDNILKTIAINQCCTLVYTSGTVGAPKAVMLSHDNLIWDAFTISEHLQIKTEGEVIVSYLPLSHIAAQMADLYVAILNGVTIYFADSNALKGSLVTTLQEAQPTRFLGVPRVWEKMQEKMMEVGRQNTGIKQKLVSWAKGQALQYHTNRMKGIDRPSWGYVIANLLVFSKIKQALGLNRCLYTASGAAPLATDVKQFFLSVDIPVYEMFGLSESGGAHTGASSDSPNCETIGKNLKGVKSKILNPEDDQGELCMYGRHIFMGYLNEQEMTDNTLDADGWLHSGDIGKIDKDQCIYITGRLKELIITAGGENVAPVLIENLLKAELPYISNAMLIGDKRKFLSILISFKTKIDEETTKPLDTLVPSVQQWLNNLKCPAKTVTEVLKAGPDPKLLQAIQQSINKVNEQAISNAQRIQKFSILPADFSISTGELGPTLKLNRRVVVAKYCDIIEKMYE